MESPKQVRFAEQNPREEDPMQRKTSENLETVTNTKPQIHRGKIREAGQRPSGELETEQDLGNTQAPNS